MKTTLEDISAVKKKLIVEIESSEIDKKLDEAYRDLGKRAKIPGFRPGKVPRKILEGRFGNQVLEDVTKNLISETFPQAINDVETFPLGPPLLEKETLKQGQSFKYSAVMEVRPQFEVKGYQGLDAEKEKFSVTDEDVLKQLEQIRESNGKLTSIKEQRPVQKDDYVILDYEGFEDDSPLEGIKSPNFLLKVGSNDFHPKFEEALIGLNKESETEIKVDFEETYHHAKLAGKSVKFKTKITDIKEMILPDLDDEFAKNLGAEFKDLEDLKDKVRESITAQEKKRIDRDLKQRLIEKISAGVDFEIPQVLVDSEVDYAIENIKQNLIRSGSNMEKAGLSEENLRNNFRPASEKRVKDMLVLGEIAKQEEITVEEEDLSEGYKDLAATMGQDPETIRKYYEARNLEDSLKEKLLEEKALNYLVEHANITEVDKIEQVEDNNKKEKD
jgi:trigger factor